MDRFQWNFAGAAGVPLVVSWRVKWEYIKHLAASMTFTAKGLGKTMKLGAKQRVSEKYITHIPCWFPSGNAKQICA